MTDVGSVAKRGLDVVAAGGGLLILSPLMAVVAVAVRATSPGPAIFTQRRVGRGGEEFVLHKFRTMKVDSPGLMITATYDARITKVGALLRRTKIDELPQLADVLVGSMSLVGPRPEVSRYVALWPAEERAVILSVRPGITDPATVILRHESEQLASTPDPEAHYIDVLLPQKVASYTEYVRTRSFVGDLRIIAQTLRALTRKHDGS